MEHNYPVLMFGKNQKTSLSLSSNVVLQFVDPNRSKYHLVTDDI